MRLSVRVLIAVTLLTPATASAQIIVNSSSIALFEQIPASYLTAARNLRMMFIGRSVGVNINQGLDCLTYAYASSPNSCRTTGQGGSAQTWTQTYARSNWTFYGWPGLGLPNPVTCNGSNGVWTGYQPCFLDFTQPRMSSWDVVSFQFDYLAGISDDPIANYFTPRPGNDDIYDFETFTAGIAPKRALHWTTSLMKNDQNNPGTLAKLDAFNVAMRSWAAQSTNRVLIDLADIISRRADGSECLSAEGHPRICDEYSSETYGGHLSNGAAKVRVAKAVWVALARMAGWVPGGSDTQPPTVTQLSCTAQSGTLTCSGRYSDSNGVASIQTSVTARDAAGNTTTASTTVTPR